MRIRRVNLPSVAAILVSVLAQAHISVQSPPAAAAVTGIVVFGVGHGCEGEGANLDTTAVTIEIPEGVTSVRPELSG